MPHPGSCLDEPLLAGHTDCSSRRDRRFLVPVALLIGVSCALFAVWVPDARSEEHAVSMVIDYSKWDKLAKEVDSDAEEEEDIRATNPEYLSQEHTFMAVPPQHYIPGGKKKLMSLLSTEPESNVTESTSDLFENYTGKEDVFREASAKICRKFGWSMIGSSFLPGYKGGSNSDEEYMWRAWYDDQFLTTQKIPNPAAHDLIGTDSTGWFVVARLNRKTQQHDPMSRKDVADLIYKRQRGKDAEKIQEEMALGRNRIAQLEKAGLNVQQVDTHGNIRDDASK